MSEIKRYSPDQIAEVAHRVMPETRYVNASDHAAAIVEARDKALEESRLHVLSFLEGESEFVDRNDLVHEIESVIFRLKSAP